MENELTKTSNGDSEAPKNANEHPASQVTNFSRLKQMPFLVEIATADTIKNDDIKIHRYGILACPIGYELVRRNLIEFDPPKDDYSLHDAKNGGSETENDTFQLKMNFVPREVIVNEMVYSLQTIFNFCDAIYKGFDRHGFSPWLC